MLTATTVSVANNRLFAAGTDELKVALIGCGNRGKGAIGNFMEAARQLDVKAKVVAVADYFKKSTSGPAARFNVSQENCYSGAKAYKDVMASDADVVLLVTPPNFRPIHFEAAIKAGKHVFMEKPVAVDPAGARKIMAAGKLATQKGLAVVAGTQRRHERKCLETQYAISKGAIGDIRSGKVYWCEGQLWHKERQPGEDDASYMIRNWVNFTEMSGDHIVEQHVHNIDIANWFIGKHPEIALGFGGRARRRTGNQFDFFSVDFDYGDGLSIHSMCRQVNGCYKRVSEFFTGTLGTTWGTGNGSKGFAKKIDVPKFECVSNPYVQEHIDLIKGIVEGKPLNEANNVAESTLTAIMGRISAYRGIPVRWKELTDETFGSPWYHLKMSPSAEDFENGTVKAPPENKAPIPGRD
jgi:predicted dehydrogenase